MGERYRPTGGPCQWQWDVDECEQPAHARGLCSRHYQRLVKANLIEPTRRLSSQPKATKLVSHSRKRYAMRYVPDHPAATQAGYVMEHRLVMEEKIGRRLHDFENVHHLNGMRRDNRPENLELWTRPQPSGQRPADLAAWVMEFYPELIAERAEQSP